MLKVVATHKEHRITKSGQFFKIFKPEGGNLTYQRFISIEAAKCCINAALEKRPYTPEEHATVYPMTWEQVPELHEQDVEEQAIPAPTTCIACGKPAPYVRQVGCNSQQPSGKWYTEFGVCAEHFGIGLTEPVPPMCDECISEQIEFEKMAEAEYLAQEDIEHTRNGYGASPDTDVVARPLSWDESDKEDWSPDWTPLALQWAPTDDEPLRNERGDRLE